MFSSVVDVLWKIVTLPPFTTNLISTDSEAKKNSYAMSVFVINVNHLILSERKATFGVKAMCKASFLSIS